jgi:hypothetical protein
LLIISFLLGGEGRTFFCVAIPGIVWDITKTWDLEFNSAPLRTFWQAGCRRRFCGGPACPV